MAKVEPLFDNFESTLASNGLHNHEQDTLHKAPMTYKSVYATHAYITGKYLNFPVWDKLGNIVNPKLKIIQGWE